MSDTTSREMSLAGVDQVRLFGENDANLRSLRQEFKVKIIARGEKLLIEGKRKQVEKVAAIIGDLINMAGRGDQVGEGDLRYAISMRNDSGAIGARGSGDRDGEKNNRSSFEDRAEFPGLRKIVRAKTLGQQQYVEAMRSCDIVFSIGPAGTGKTYLAMAQAVWSLRRKDIDRILLVRPAVEAGESLGFLPGDLEEKVGPYLRPLYDALYEMMPAEKIKKSLEIGVIEVAPLGYMRGRTLNNSFVILDEAQNTTLDQMKMFLTRLGFNSKAVITGDVTQIDLSRKEDSGLVLIQSILKGIKGIEFIYLSGKDVVRHRLVQEIIRAFDKYGPGDKKPGS